METVLKRKGVTGSSFASNGYIITVFFSQATKWDTCVHFCFLVTEEHG